MLREIQDTLKKFEVKDIPDTTHGKRGSAAIEELLVTEGATKNFEIDFKHRISQVSNGECMIVISGRPQFYSPMTKSSKTMMHAGLT